MHRSRVAMPIVSPAGPSETPRDTHSAPPPTPPAPRARWPHALASFESSNFRWLFAATLAGSLGNWMETVVRSFVVYQLTESAFILGLVHSGRAAPAILFGFLGGVLADRLDRRLLLMGAQTIHGCCGAGLGVLLVSGLIEPWHFGVAALIEGTVGAVQQPVRQALVPAVVPRAHLMNAISLSGSTQQLAKTVAPAIAGIFAAIYSPAAALFLEAGLYMGAMIATAQLPPMPASPAALPAGQASGGQGSKDAVPRRGRRTLIDGFRGYGYLRENPVVGWLVVLAIVPIIFSFANNTMAPVFSMEVLGLGPGGVGLLLAAPGIGSLVASVICAWKGDFPRKGLLSMAGILFMGITTILYGLSSVLWLSLAALALHGLAQTFYRVLNHTLVQMHTPDEYRGRVMATYYMDRSFNPLGTMVVAGMADIWSPQAAMVVSGAGCAVTVLVIGARARAVRELD